MRFLNISKDDKLLIIGPHPDDESIGCGGLISLYANQIDIIVMTDGARGNIKNTLIEMKRIRKKELEKALKNTEINSYVFLDYPDGELVFHDDCMSSINIENYTKIFVPHYSELHADHRAVFNYLIKKVADSQLNDIEIYQYETRSAVNEDIVGLDISVCIKNKLEMIRCYESQLGEYDYVHFAESLAKYHASKDYQKAKYIEAYVRYENQSVQKGNIEDKILTEYRIKNDLLDLWLNLHIQSRRINDFIGVKYKNVAIYGYGYFGKLLYKDIVSSGGEVSFVIDRNADALHKKGIRFITPQKDENVDLLIISNLFEGEKIKNDMLTLGYRNVVTLRDILVYLNNYTK